MHQPTAVFFLSFLFSGEEGLTYVSNVATVSLEGDNLSRSDGRHGDWVGGESDRFRQSVSRQGIDRAG